MFGKKPTYHLIHNEICTGTRTRVWASKGELAIALLSREGEMQDLFDSIGCMESLKNYLTVKVMQGHHGILIYFTNGSKLMSLDLTGKYPAFFSETTWVLKKQLGFKPDLLGSDE